MPQNPRQTIPDLPQEQIPERPIADSAGVAPQVSSARTARASRRAIPCIHALLALSAVPVTWVSVCMRAPLHFYHRRQKISSGIKSAISQQVQASPAAYSLPRGVVFRRPFSPHQTVVTKSGRCVGVLMRAHFDFDGKKKRWQASPGAELGSRGAPSSVRTC